MPELKNDLEVGYARGSEDFGPPIRFDLIRVDAEGNWTIR